ncbi:MAG TPA: hypothetical protein VNL17_14425 [Verrucomicrobiae bacterium]|nr:hypothetical protein [Verrucomicrobiae bacterium]
MTKAQIDALNVLLDSGLDAATIGAEASAQAIEKARLASVSTIPLLPTLSDTDKANFKTWLLDGKGTNDARGEAQLAVDALLANDAPTAVAHGFQLLKNVIFFIYPDIGEAALKQIQQ